MALASHTFSAEQVSPAVPNLSDVFRVSPKPEKPNVGMLPTM